MTLHVPFIGLLGGNDLLIGILAQPLRGGQVRMAPRRDIPLGRLSDGESSNQEEEAQDSSGDSDFSHSCDSNGATRFVQRTCD